MVEVEVQQQQLSLLQEETSPLSPQLEDEEDQEEMTQYELQCAAWEHSSSEIHGLLDYEMHPELDSEPCGSRDPVDYDQRRQDYASKIHTTAEDWHTQSETVQAEITVPLSKVGLLIGRGGRTIKSLQERTRTRMHIIQDLSKYNSEDPAQEVFDKTLIITGAQESVAQAEELIYDFISKAPSTPPNRNKDYSESDWTGSSQHYNDFAKDRRAPFTNRTPNRSGRIKTVRIQVPKVAVGLIIGKGGESIKRIRIETGAKVQFNPLTPGMSDMDEQIAIITGRSDQIRHACDLIEELIDTASKTPEDLQRRQLQQRNVDNSWSENFMGPASESVSISGEGIEEEKIAIPIDKVRKVIGKGRETIRNICRQSGASCELDRAVTEGPDKFILVSGKRSQVEHARELIFERVNASGNDQRINSDPVYQQQIPEQFGPSSGCCMGQEWTQTNHEQTTPWSYYEPAYYDPIQLGYQDYYMNVPANATGEYPQWSQYFNPAPPTDPQSMPNPGWTGGQPGQEPKPDPIPPVPIMSATIVQNTDRSSQYPAPPTVYFSIPTSPFQPPMNTPPTHEQPQPQPPAEPEPDVLKAESMEEKPTVNNADGDHNETQPSPAKVDEPCETTGSGDHSEAPEPKEAVPDPGNCPPPGFEPYRVMPPNPNAVPGLSYPSNIGTPGSCTRIVSFYYDLNVNSIVILNQWHFY